MANLADAPDRDQEQDAFAAALAEITPPPPGGTSEPVLPFDAWIDAQAAWYRSFGTEAADWMAARVAELAAEARFHGAASPADFDDRRAAQEDWLRERDRHGD